ncbi:MAG: hypothetical protein V3U53_09250 [bacterium]
MLTNCHTLILRNLLSHGPEPPPDERDLYLYNVAPDHLPLSKRFKSRETHRFAPPEGALARHPKLIWVKCHLIVDNFCHYGAIIKLEGRLTPSEKKGYTYRRGADLIPLFTNFAREMDVPLDASAAHYLAHTMVEIAVDYLISQADRTVPTVIRQARAQASEEQMREYDKSLAALYGRSPEDISATQGAAERFYGNVDDIDYMYLDGRTRIILRKLRLPFSEENTARTRKLILDSAGRIPDYMAFIDESVALLSDRAAWAGDAPLASEAD